jgi:O-antigen chain-terminating methyltransferase
MLETSEPTINVDELVSRMREGAARQQINNNLFQRDDQLSRNEINIDSDFSEIAARANSAGAPLVLQPAFEPHADDSYHVKDLLIYHDRDFLLNAYRALLKRTPDAAGFKEFINQLRAGRINKIDVLARLHRSPEGVAKSVRVEGLRWPARIRSVYRLPVIGYVAQWLIAVLRLPVMIRSQQQFESYTIAQQQMITDHLNEAHAQLAKAAHALALEQQRQRRATDEMRERLAGLNQHLEASLASMSRHVSANFDQLKHHTEALLDQLQRHVEARFKETSVHLQQQKSEQQRGVESFSQNLQSEIELLSRNLGKEIEHVAEQQQETRVELVLQARRVSLLLEEARDQLTAAPEKKQLQVFADEEDHTLDALYISLEDRLRGSRAEIINRLKVYLPLLKQACIGAPEMPVLDVGCGRGEWLELLKTEGLNATGVDTNSIAIAQCREHELDVLEADVLSHLRGLPEQSVGAITGFHIIEHLPLDVLMKLLDETVRVLKPGGVVIFETPNPQNVLVGSCNFYFDPTHRNPLPSQVMQFLIESRGFARVKIMTLNPSDALPVEGDSDLVKRFNQLFYGPMDYAVIGWKPAA